MSTADSPCPGYGCTPPGFYRSSPPSYKETDSTSIPGSAQRSKPVIPEVTPKNQPARENIPPGSQQKEDKKNYESSEEIYHHTPFLMIIKRWDWLPENITSKKDDETISPNPVANLTGNKNSTRISFESQNNSTESNKVPCCLKISKHATRMDNQNRLLTSLEHATSSSPAETGNYNVSSPAIIDIGMDKGLVGNNSGRSHGQIEEPGNVTRFKDHDNASMGTGNAVTLGWSELPKDVNQNCFNWRSVTMSTADSPCPGYGCTPPRLRNIPRKKVTESSSIPGSARRSKPVIPVVTPKTQPARGNMSPSKAEIDDHSSTSDETQNTATIKKHESSEEMYHTPFLMLIKQWVWLPENDNETMPAIPVANLTENQNRISFESQENRTEYNNVSRMDMKNRFFTPLENQASTCPAKTGNYNANSSEIIEIRMDKASAANHSRGSPELTVNITRFKDHDNAVLGIGNEATPKDWIEETLTDHKFEMCSLRSSTTGLELGQCLHNATRNPSDGTWRFHNLTNYYWNRFQTKMKSCTWQDTFDALIIFWMTYFCVIELYLTIYFVKEIIPQIRLQRELVLEEERERLLELERAAQPKPKKRRRKKKNK